MDVFHPACLPVRSFDYHEVRVAWVIDNVVTRWKMNSSRNKRKWDMRPHHKLLDRHLGLRQGSNEYDEREHRCKLDHSGFHTASVFSSRPHDASCLAERQCKRDRIQMENR